MKFLHKCITRPRNLEVNLPEGTFEYFARWYEIIVLFEIQQDSISAPITPTHCAFACRSRFEYINWFWPAFNRNIHYEGLCAGVNLLDMCKTSYNDNPCNSLSLRSGYTGSLINSRKTQASSSWEIPLCNNQQQIKSGLAGNFQPSCPLFILDWLYSTMNYDPIVTARATKTTPPTLAHCVMKTMKLVATLMSNLY